MIQIASYLNLLYVEFPPASESGALYSDEQILAAGMQIALDISKAGYSISYGGGSYKNAMGKKMNLIEISITKDNVKWKIIDFRNEHDKRRKHLHIDPYFALGVSFMHCHYAFYGFSPDQNPKLGHIVFMCSRTEYPLLTYCTGQSVSSKLNQMLCELLKATYFYTKSKVDGFSFYFKLNPQDAELIAALAASIGQDWTELAEILAAKCLEPAKEAFRALPMDKPAFKGFDPFVVQLIFSINYTKHDVILRNSFADTDWDKFRRSLEQIFLNWANSVFAAPKIS